MDNKDYYYVLGVNPDASDEEIKRAYRKLAMQCHPDHNHGKEEWANQKFREINEAFSVLSDPEKKRQYDVFGSVDNINDIFNNKATKTAFEGVMNDFGDDYLRFGFLDDTYGEDLIGRGFRFRAFRRGFGGSKKSRFETQNGIDLEDLFTPVKSPEVSNVKYEIVLSQEQAFMGMQKELIRKGKRLKVNIPAGVETGSKLKLRNALQTTDGQPGDITIIIRVT